MNSKPVRIYMVRLHKPKKGQDSLYFVTSLSAIFDHLTEKDVGVSIDVLYAMKVSRKGIDYKNDRCEITQHELWRKQKEG